MSSINEALEDWPRTSGKYWTKASDNYRKMVAACLDDKNCFYVDVWEWKVTKGTFQPDGKKRDFTKETARFSSQMMTADELQKTIDGMQHVTGGVWQTGIKAFVSTVLFPGEVGKIGKNRLFYNLPGDTIKF